MHEKLRHSRGYLLTQLLSAILLQVALCGFLIHDTYWKVDVAFPDAIPSIAVTFTRFTVGMLMHLALSG